MYFETSSTLRLYEYITSQLGKVDFEHPEKESLKEVREDVDSKLEDARKNEKLAEENFEKSKKFLEENGKAFYKKSDFFRTLSVLPVLLSAGFLTTLSLLKGGINLPIIPFVLSLSVIAIWFLVFVVLSSKYRAKGFRSYIETIDLENKLIEKKKITTQLFDFSTCLKLLSEKGE